MAGQVMLPLLRVEGHAMVVGNMARVAAGRAAHGALPGDFQHLSLERPLTVYISRRV